MIFFSQTISRIAWVRWTVLLLVLMFIITPLLALQAVAQDDDVGLPIHPKAILSTITRQSGEGEGTRWVKVHFTVNAPYKQVVKFYQEKVGRNAQISEIDSGKLLNTLILFRRDLTDQFNVNISSELGRKVAKVELSRNFARP
ncbi:MAG: hypothetical protein F9K13_00240 [Candidatus Methylomirabilis oxygeniifera]|uniref:Uncharacterized protein n=1 Tax=Methylomirabilis oxygeniifera TaxID=671143 RepID=D5MIA1_METO1|nr:MAG: hypothetical protein F9K13_00240 [Candidatus Methylomirabilis oxyfera]CBE67251.1 exported protein of unknown function [Candidatus Methylomirabilis oxyfera]